MINLDRESAPNKYTGLRIAGIITLAGLPVAAGCTKSAIIEQTNKPMPSATALDQFIKGITPEASSTSTPPSSPTEATKPVTPTTAPATVTATVVEQKPLLPRYGAYLGDLLNAQTGAREGTIVVAQIPDATAKNNTFVYWWSYRNNMKTMGAFIANAESIQNGAFQVSERPGGVWRMQFNVEDSKILSGNIQIGTPGKAPTWQSNFITLPFTGSGKNAVIYDIKLGKAAMFNTPVESALIDDVQAMVDFTKFPAN